MSPLLLVATLAGPIYFAIRDTTWLAVLVWAVACAGIWMFSNRRSLVSAQREAFDSKTPAWFGAFAHLALFLGVAAAFNTAHFAAFLVTNLID